MDEMPSSELVRWIGYFKIKAEEEKKRHLEHEARRGLDTIKHRHR